jgi:acetyl-CoA synthetase
MWIVDLPPWIRPARFDRLDPSPELVAELQQFVKKRLAAHAYPREVEFVGDLPKTPSGKIQRFVLRRREVEKSNKSSES